MRWRVAFGTLLLLLAGGLLGRWSTPAPPPAHSSPPLPRLTQKWAGMRGGFDRTREGAALAAGSYQRAFADPGILNPSELRQRIEAVATPTFARVMIAANEPGTARLREGAFGDGIRAGVPSVFIGVPVGYRVLSFTPDRAVIRTWGFTLLGNTTSVEPSAYFGLSRTVLIWQEGNWKIAHTRGSFGPTPRLATPRPGGEGLGLVELTQELRRYGLAP